MHWARFSPSLTKNATKRFVSGDYFARKVERFTSGVIPDSAFPSGYLAGGVAAGVKKAGSAKLDVAVIASTQPVKAAGFFTQNASRAAPVLVSEALLKSGEKVSSVAVNSGNANAVTGQQGLKDAERISSEAGAHLEKLGITGKSLVMSTGVIGQPLPMDRVSAGVEKAAGSLKEGYAGWAEAAEAIMTTDTFPKLRVREGPGYKFVGIDKGAGMIHPRMGPPHATLLGVIATDASVAQDALDDALAHAMQRSFNSISIDGDTSTNDTILVLANGTGEEIQKNTPAFDVFQAQLTDFATELAQLIVRDGEGATKFVEIRVSEAATYRDAHRLASSVACSALVKCAFHGEDANWGRILCALGYAEGLSSPLDTLRVSVSFVSALEPEEPLVLLSHGEPVPVDEERAKALLSAEDLLVDVRLGVGKETASYYTCDLSREYININADYRS